MAIYFLDKECASQAVCPGDGNRMGQIPFLILPLRYRITIATIAGPEIAAAISRSRSARGIAQADASTAMSSFRSDSCGTS